MTLRVETSDHSGITTTSGVFVDMSVYSGSNATMISKVSQSLTVLLKTKRTDALSVLVNETQIDIAKNKIEQEGLGIFTERRTLALRTTCLNLSQQGV